MADIQMLTGLTLGNGNNVLMAAFGGDAYLGASGLWTSQGQGNLSTTPEMITCKGYGYLYNLNTTPKTYSPAFAWSTTTNVAGSPRAKYPITVKDRLIIGNCYFNGDYYRRRFFYTDIIEKEDSVVWGLEYGSDLGQLNGSKYIDSNNSKFITKGIKIGDPFVILSGTNAGIYAVASIVSETVIELNRAVTYTQKNCRFFVGGNWEDLNDDITGMGEHYGVTLPMEYNRAYRWSPSLGKRVIFGVPGTSSHRSIVNNHGGYTFWFHPSGMIRFNGTGGEIVSSKIQPYIDGIDSANYGLVVGWPGVGAYKDHLYMYVGDITNATYDIALTNAVIDFNIARNTFKFHEAPAKITCAARLTESNVETVYLGTDKSLVLKWGTGSSDYDCVTNNGTATLEIETYGETWPIFLNGPEVINNFIKVLGYVDRGTAIKLQYKIYGTPENDNSDWSDVLELNQMYNEFDTSNLELKGRGIAFRFYEISKDESFLFSGLSYVLEALGEAYDGKLP